MTYRKKSKASVRCVSSARFSCAAANRAPTELLFVVHPRGFSDMTKEHGVAGAAVTCAELQQELQKFAKEKLPELFQSFAQETAKISCEQLKEVLASQKNSQGSRPTLTRLASAVTDCAEAKRDMNHEWSHRHIRPAAVRDASKPVSQHTSVKEIWNAVAGKGWLKPENEASALRIMPQPSQPSAAWASRVVATRSCPPVPGSIQEEPGQGPFLPARPVLRSSIESMGPPFPEQDEKEEEQIREDARESGLDLLMQRFHRGSLQSLHEQHGGSSRSWWRIYEMLVYAWPMEYLTLMVILVNAFCLGLETNIMAVNLTSQTPEEFIALGWFFCAFFTLEMVLKISANPSRFFFGAAWQLNLLDLLLMALQWIDIAGTISTAHGESNNVNLDIMRAVRMVRLVRIVRSYRVLKMLGEVRAIIWSVSTCMKPLFGAVLILLTLMYLLAVFLVDTCTSRRLAADISEEGFQQLGELYGHVSRCMLTMCQIITGGMDWGTAAEPLILYTGPLAVFVLFCYIAFALLALLNVITGICVESAVKRGKEDKDSYLVQYVRGVFQRMDTSGAGVITWDDFRASLHSKDMKELFKAIDLDISEARCVFKILDLDDDGTLDAEEFLSGCLRLRGPAKALDVMVLMRELKAMHQQLQ